MPITVNGKHGKLLLPEMSEVAAWYIVTIVLGVVTTSLRIYVKLSRRNKERMRLDDTLILIGTVLSLAMAGMVIGVANSSLIQVKHGLLTQGANMRLIKVALILKHLYGTCLATAKLGILALYHRVFVGVVFRKCVWGTAVLTILWWISMEVIGFTYCIPFRKIWRYNDLGWCMDPLSVGLYESCMNLVINLWIFMLPLQPICKLQTDTWRKAVFAILFCCGAGTCAVSSYRIWIMTHSYAGHIHLVNLRGYQGCLALFEATCTIACANAPFLYKLVSQAFRKTQPSTNGIQLNCSTACAARRGLSTVTSQQPSMATRSDCDTAHLTGTGESLTPRSFVTTFNVDHDHRSGRES